MKTQAIPVHPSRVADFVALTKPRIAVLVLFTVAVGVLLAQRGTPDFAQMLHVIFGTTLVAASASAFNQLMERQSDSLMRRTENRPLPAGRLLPGEVFVFASILGLAGIGYLAFTLKQPLAAFVAGFTLVAYVFLYTPLKRVTTLNTLIGAVPGALPPIIGWTSVTGRLDTEALVLFLILFLWQIPHFMAIAWIYREDYARAGLQMVPTVDRDGSMTARQMVLYCLALIVASVMPYFLREASIVYLVGASVLGLAFFKSTWGFARERDTLQARRVLHASLLYLPAVLALLMIEHWMRPAVMAFQP